MTQRQTRTLMTLALAGITAGLTGCGGSPPPDAASPAAEPASEKSGCKGEGADKHSCNGEMKKEDMKEGGTMPAAPDMPAEKKPGM